MGDLRVLNLYCGLGGNRKLWQDCQVVAVENNIEVADAYQEFFPEDKVIVGDAHQYLINNFTQFDFIWSSPPCQSHSRMTKATRHKIKKYPDLSLYQEIIFLNNFFKGVFVVENVNPYYQPLIKPTAIVGRHLFWSNVSFNAHNVKSPANFINETSIGGKNKLMEWLEIYLEKNIYLDGNHCPAQVFRNCVHPILGNSIFNQLRKIKFKTNNGCETVECQVEMNYG